MRTSLPASRAFLCDLLERNRDEVEMRNGELEVELAPFKILTLKLERDKNDREPRRSSQPPMDSSAP
jgi:hypothetical protein